MEHDLIRDHLKLARYVQARQWAKQNKMSRLHDFEITQIEEHSANRVRILKALQNTKAVEDWKSSLKRMATELVLNSARCRNSASSSALMQNSN